jgi:Cd2+/Zn2+-exporting ATPase
VSLCVFRKGRSEKIRSKQEAEKIVEQLASQGKTSVVVTGTGVAGIIDTDTMSSILAIAITKRLYQTIMLTGIVKSSSLCSRCRRYQKVFGGLLQKINQNGGL